MSERLSGTETYAESIRGTDGRSYKVVAIRPSVPTDVIHPDGQPIKQATTQYEDTRRPNVTKRNKRGNIVTHTAGSLAGLALASALAIGAGEFAGNSFQNGLPDSVAEAVEYIVPDTLIGDK